MDNISLNSSQNLIGIVTRPDFIGNLFDAVRLVDPVHKEVRSYFKADSSIVQSGCDNCFGIWDRDTVCENCISMRSYNQKRTAVKIEYGNARIYIVTAVPFTANDNSPAVIELLKDITDDGVININGLEPTELKKLVNRRNEAIIKDALAAVYNEQYIFERLPYDLINASRKQSSLALFLIRIANIEAITNAKEKDLHDNIFREIAKTVNQIPYKSGDWASRYREANFVLVIHDINDNQAKRLCQRIREKLNRVKLDYLPPDIDIQITIGFHIVTGENLTPEQILENAGKAQSESGVAAIGNRFPGQFAKFMDKHLLTLREREVTSLLVEGKTNNEIAEKLFIGLSTVKKHVSSIFTKTNTRSRAELIMKLAVVKP